MIARVYTVAFEGLEARLVEVQCAISPGLPAFNLVGLPTKAVSEAKERVRAAITALGLALIAVAGALPAALAAAAAECTLVCPEACGAEAAWVGAAAVIAPASLMALVNHVKGQAVLAPAEPGVVAPPPAPRCLSEVKGQEKAKRAFEIAAAGRHHLFLVGPPGSGKSMMAARMPGLLPPLDPAEALETSMIHSLAGLLREGGILRTRPFMEPHHTASRAAIVGGGRQAQPGQMSLAHHGVLFLDEVPEFEGRVLESLRQPLETGDVVVARANAHVRYPCKFLLVAAANPCRCGHMAEPARACARAPGCGADYLGRISGPLMDRFDLRVEVPPVALADLKAAPAGETSADIAARIAAARDRQAARQSTAAGARLNADLEGEALIAACPMDADATDLIARAADRFRLTARGYHRVLRVARTIADLGDKTEIARQHMAEALSYRLSLRNVCPSSARQAGAFA